jgi:aspartate-semialdehyde dehydrogenase
MKIAVVGATGLVGTVMLKVLEERNFPVTELYPVASQKSVGKELTFKNKGYKVIGIQDAVNLKPDIALFSAGGSISREWAPKFADAGTFVIDNSSAWRMDPSKKLIVPEINAHLLNKEDKIIANPNCSTIQLVVALNPLHLKYKIKRIVVSTYQSVTGTGVKAVKQMMDERQGKETVMEYPHQIDMNCFPHGGDFLENGYTTEEQKLIDETQKIISTSSDTTASSSDKQIKDEIATSTDEASVKDDNEEQEVEVFELSQIENNNSTTTEIIKFVSGK